MNQEGRFRSEIGFGITPVSLNFNARARQTTVGR
jgi:hypothetical protein